MAVWPGRRERFEALADLRCYRELRDTRRIERSLGTLGGGNHFIEIDQAMDGTRYLVIHSGSRNLGKQVAEHYQHLAVELNRGKGEYYARRDALIAEYKAQGRRSEIQEALRGLHWDPQELKVPEDLCDLTGTALADYLHDVGICQLFALRNRESMAQFILEQLGLESQQAFHTVHNYIHMEEMILRKGAIAAHRGELVLIPVNMRDGSILARGKGNEEWNYSAPHGAGRLLSRSAAREQLDLNAYRREMAGIYTTSVSEATLDEAPMAYKSLEDIIGVIGESVDILEVLKPIYNFKAG
jgi:RNA-splicing ligase RtcB